MKPEETSSITETLEESMKKDSFINDFSRMICPEIIGNGYPWIKKILSLQMFCNARRTGERVHILLTGPPSTGKTKVGLDVSKIMGISHYASCSSQATKVGLREILMDKDGGLVVIDEVDKLWDEKNILLESMSEGTVTVDMKGIHYTKPAMVNFLLLCNPIGEEFGNRSVLSEIPFSQALQSRIHLVISCTKPEKELFKTIAKNKARGGETEEMKKDRRDKMLSIIEFAHTTVPSVAITEEIAEKVGEHISEIEDNSEMRRKVDSRLIDGYLSLIRAKSRMGLKSEATEKEFRFVKREVFDRTFLPRKITGRWDKYSRY